MQNQLKTVVLGLLSGLSIAIGYWIIGGSRVIVAIAIADVMNLLSWYRSGHFC